MLVPLIISALVSAILCAALLRKAYGRHILCICAAWRGCGRRRHCAAIWPRPREARQ
jgi:hypothetical protein